MFTRFVKKIYYWHFLVALILLRYATETIVAAFQYFYLRQTAVPRDLAQLGITKALWDVLRQKQMHTFQFYFWEHFANSGINLVIVGFGLIPMAWKKFSEICERRFSWLRGEERTFLRSVIFYIMYDLFDACIKYPFIWCWPSVVANIDLAAHFLLVPDRLLDNFTTLLTLKLAIRHRVLFGALCITIFSSLMTCSQMFYPKFKAEKNFILYTNAVSSGMEREMVLSLLKKVGFPSSSVFLDPKMRNAFNSGVFFGSILVIGGALKAIMNSSELLAIMAHELGHWKGNHILQDIVLMVAKFAFVLSLKLLIIPHPPMYRSFNIEMGGKIPFGVGMVILDMFLAHFHFILDPIANVISWAHEYEADEFACKIGYGRGLFTGLLKLEVMNPKNILATTIYGYFHTDHPVFADRLRAIAKWK